MNYDRYAEDLYDFYSEQIPDGYVSLEEIPNLEACADLLKDAVMAVVVENDMKAFASSLQDIIDEFNRYGYKIPSLEKGFTLESFANLTRCYASSLKKGE